jgi:hypothetical protein
LRWDIAVLDRTEKRAVEEVDGLLLQKLWNQNEDVPHGGEHSLSLTQRHMREKPSLCPLSQLNGP